MGGGPRFKYPKYFWSTYGGWWVEPKNQLRNTVIACTGLGFVWWQLFQFSAANERRHNAPVRPIPSQLWEKYAEIDDPSYKRPDGFWKRRYNIEDGTFAKSFDMPIDAPIKKAEGLKDIAKDA
eukprot:TRINITY_DN4159_c0_g1_i2.p2 TRINITY_DN4159_c0_g1~~TRINITY_DN4159_c0_g1_i2.p2  ORF type:complete len:123 (-),score=35.66 TRINITY_DN4159_c0_g1_i2:473-841(-)